MSFWTIALLALLLTALLGLLLRRRAPSPPASRSEGRARIDRALERIHPDAPNLGVALYPEPGESFPPLAEVAAYRASGSKPHWHYTTYGLSELDEKVMEDAEVSGFGVEYTLRLVDDSPEPPIWPINLLRFIAKTVWETGQPFHAMHTTNLPGGILDAVSPGVEGLSFVDDPELAPIETPNGRVAFVNVVPLMREELGLVRGWDIHAFADALRADQGDLLWRVGRVSLLDGDRSAELRAAVERDGSSSRVAYVELTWTDGELVLDETDRAVLTSLLRHRIAHGRDALVVAGDRQATFSAADWQMDCQPDACAVSIPADEARALADALDGAQAGATLTRPNGVRLRLER